MFERAKRSEQLNGVLSAGKIKNGDTPAVADDFYNRYMDDIATAKVGTNENLARRRTASWPIFVQVTIQFKELAVGKD